MGRDEHMAADADGVDDTQILKRAVAPEPAEVVVRAAVAGALLHWVARPGTVATVGRSPDADLVLADPSVSRLHARFEVDAAGGVTITDLTSTNGTWVNQVRLTGTAPVEPGDRVLAGAISMSVERLTATEIAALEQANERIGEAARDAVTGLFGRRWLDRELPAWVERFRKDGGFVCCLFVDIDHFKRINDTHKHAMGDRVLREVADLVRKGIRDDDVAVRYGGDEIVVFLPRCRLSVGVAVAERVRAAVLAHGWGAPLGAGSVTLSIGVAQLAPQETLGAWMDRADGALYRAKETRNCVVAIE